MEIRGEAQTPYYYFFLRSLFLGDFVDNHQDNGYESVFSVYVYCW